MKFFLHEPAARIALLFAVVSGAWLAVSGFVVLQFASDPATLSRLESYKGAVYVAVVALILYFERRRADRRLKHFAAIVESSDDAIIGVDPDGVITSWNRGAEQLYGYPADEVVGRSVAFLYPEDTGDLQRFLTVYRSGKSLRHVETVRVTRDGRRLDVALTVSPIRSARGRIEGIATVARDMTDRSRAEQAARLAEVGRLASGLVHEIRNPLNAMRMQMAVIRDMLEERGASEILDEVEHLEHEVLRVHNLASDFLAYGRPAPELDEVIPLDRFIREIAQFLGPEFSGGGVEVTVEGHDPDLRVCADRNKLKQVVFNLAQNARHAMAEKGGNLTLWSGRGLSGAAVVRIQDTGRGIAPEDRDRIFDAFFSTHPEGSGLGLAIVKQIVEAAGGSIAVQSEVDQGTTFEITLPVARSGRAQN